MRCMHGHDTYSYHRSAVTNFLYFYAFVEGTCVSTHDFLSVRRTFLLKRWAWICPRHLLSSVASIKESVVCPHSHRMHVWVDAYPPVCAQVISLAVLGIDPEESDRKLSCLYLPIIDECNDRYGRHFCVLHDFRNRFGFGDVSVSLGVTQALWCATQTKRMILL